MTSHFNSTIKVGGKVVCANLRFVLVLTQAAQTLYTIYVIKLLAIALRFQPFGTMYENALKIAVNATGTK